MCQWRTFSLLAAMPSMMWWMKEMGMKWRAVCKSDSLRSDFWGSPDGAAALTSIIRPRNSKRGVSRTRTGALLIVQFSAASCERDSMPEGAPDRVRLDLARAGGGDLEVVRLADALPQRDAGVLHRHGARLERGLGLRGVAAVAGAATMEAE